MVAIPIMSSYIRNITQTRAEVTSLCQQYHVPAAPLLDVVELLADPHLHARGFLTDVSTEAGLVALPNSAIRYDGIPAADADADPAPLLGEHMDEVLSELCGLDEADIAGRRNDGVI